MNVGSLQGLIGGVGQVTTSGAHAGRTTNNGGFGSVFNTMVAGNTVVAAPEALNKTDAELNEAITSILDATSLEEIVSILKGIEVSTDPDMEKQIDANISLENRTENTNIEELLLKIQGVDSTDLNAQYEFLTTFMNLPQLEQLVGELDMDAKKLFEQLMPLLEKAGLSESEFEAAKYANDIWALLDIVDKVAPKFFTELKTALEGKGAILKEDAIQLLAILKAIEVEAPKVDLLEKQEQQVVTLQGFLAIVSEKIETMQPTTPNRQTVVQMLETQQAMRIISQTQTGQNQTNEESLKESPKETIQQPVVSPTQQLSMREEIRLAQPESNSNARNEALMREMQNIFKRSSFGQAGGTNRLLVKLYPEHLGQVRIELLQQNGVMTARILASSALGKEMLDSQLHQLRAAFAQQNLQVERIDISQSLQDTSRNDRDNAFNQHFKREQEQTEQQQEQSSEDERSFEDYMIELEA